MKRRWGTISTRFIVITVTGTAAVLLATAFARPVLMSREIATAEKLLALGKAGEALGHLDRCRTWSTYYPPLDKKRLYLTIRCHARRLDLARAIRLSEELIDVDTYGFRPHTCMEKAEWVLTQPPLLTTLKQHNGHDIQPWDGYLATAIELRDLGEEKSLRALIKTIDKRYPDNAVADQMKRLLQPGFKPVQSTSTPHTPSTPTYTEPVLPSTPTKPQTVQPAANTADENARWAVVTKASTPAYRENGTRFMDLPVGTLLSVHDQSRTTSGETVAIGRVVGGNGTVVIVRAAALDIQHGSIDNVSQRERSLRIQRAKLLDALAAMPQAGHGAQPKTEANPHESAYRAARSEYLAFGDKVHSLTDGMNSSTGAKRMEYANQLRSLKGEDVRLKQAYDDTRSKYAAWEDTHPNAHTATERGNGNDAVRIEAELARLEDELRSL